MSATTHPVAAADTGHHEASKFHIFVQLAMILAVITGVEIVLIYLPLVKWLVVTTLVVLSLVVVPRVFLDSLWLILRDLWHRVG